MVDPDGLCTARSRNNETTPNASTCFSQVSGAGTPRPSIQTTANFVSLTVFVVRPFSADDIRHPHFPAFHLQLASFAQPRVLLSLGRGLHEPSKYPSRFTRPLLTPVVCFPSTPKTPRTSHYLPRHGPPTPNTNLIFPKLAAKLWVPRLQNPEHLLIFAAGNSGDATSTTSSCTMGSPAIGKNVLAVGSSSSGETRWTSTLADGGARSSLDEDAGDIDTVSWFSSNGPTLDNRIKPELVAPGDGVRQRKDAASKFVA